jgi:hypothetical protein
MVDGGGAGDGKRSKDSKIRLSDFVQAEEDSTDRQSVEINIEAATDRNFFGIFISTELVCLTSYKLRVISTDRDSLGICIEAATDRQFIEISIELVCLTILHYHQSLPPNLPRVSNIMRFAIITMAAADATMIIWPMATIP